jgi:hypothetical protein
MLAPKQMICLSGDRTTYAARHAQIVGRRDRDGSDETELTVTATARDIQNGA